MGHCISRFQLMQLHAGDLSDEARKSLEDHLQNCDACRLSYETLKRNVDGFKTSETTHLARVMRAIDASGAPVAKRTIISRRTLIWASASLATAASLLLVLLLRSEAPSEKDIAFKGEVTVALIAKRNAEQFEVKEGARLRKNDHVRFVVTTAHAGYVAIFSMDDKGILSNYYPETESADPVFLSTPGRHELPGSVILDDSTGEEQFVVAFSETLFHVNGAVSAWKDHRNGEKINDAGKEISIQSITIVKETPDP